MQDRGTIDSFFNAALPLLLSGHKPTWDHFVLTSLPLVHAVVDRALAPVGSSDDLVADVVQQVFVRLRANGFRLLREVDPDRSAFSTWLAVVSWSCASAWRPVAESSFEVRQPA